MIYGRRLRRHHSGHGGARALVVVLAGAGLFACTPSGGAGGEDTAAVALAEASFDGANYSTDTAKIAHGRRIAEVLSCNACHGQDYSGENFGEVIPLLDGLWATNISRTIPGMGDDELERVLREGVHPSREIYLMPSKQSQFLSGRDMGALIAFLRTIEPTGDETPLPPPGFEEAVTARLPDDYWRTTSEGRPRSYHNAAEEVEYFADNAAPDLGPASAQGRLIALTVCSSCHGAALDGVGEPAGGVQGALEYDDAQFTRLLRDGIRRDGQPLTMNWGTGHTPSALTDNELQAAMSYTRRLATQRAGDAR